MKLVVDVEFPAAAAVYPMDIRGDLSVFGFEHNRMLSRFRGLDWSQDGHRYVVVPPRRASGFRHTMTAWGLLWGNPVFSLTRCVDARHYDLFVVDTDGAFEARYGPVQRRSLAHQVARPWFALPRELVLDLDPLLRDRMDGYLARRRASPSALGVVHDEVGSTPPTGMLVRIGFSPVVLGRSPYVEFSLSRMLPAGWAWRRIAGGYEIQGPVSEDADRYVRRVARHLRSIPGFTDCTLRLAHHRGSPTELVRPRLAEILALGGGGHGFRVVLRLGEPQPDDRLVLDVLRPVDAATADGTGSWHAGTATLKRSDLWQPGDYRPPREADVGGTSSSTGKEQ